MQKDCGLLSAGMAKKPSGPRVKTHNLGGVHVEPETWKAIKQRFADTAVAEESFSNWVRRRLLK